MCLCNPVLCFVLQIILNTSGGHVKNTEEAIGDIYAKTALSNSLSIFLMPGFSSEIGIRFLVCCSLWEFLEQRALAANFQIYIRHSPGGHFEETHTAIELICLSKKKVA